MKNIKNTKKYWKYRSGKGGWENPSLPDLPDLPDPTPNSVQFQTWPSPSTTSPVATVGIGELSPSKFKYEKLRISKDFIKFSECQVPLHQFKSPIHNFLATVLIFKPHIFSRDS